MKLWVIKMNLLGSLRTLEEVSNDRYHRLYSYYNEKGTVGYVCPTHNESPYIMGIIDNKTSSKIMANIIVSSKGDGFEYYVWSIQCLSLIHI